MTTPLFGINELSGSTLSFNNLNTILRHYEQLGGLALSGLAAAPPTSPSDGEAYLVISAATGAFLGREDEVAFSVGGAWYFLTPSLSLEAFDTTLGNMLFYNGATWMNSPAQSVVSYQAVAAVVTLDYARTIIVESTANVTHTLNDLTISAQTTIINSGAVDMSVTASGVTTVVPAGTNINLVHSLSNNWLVY